MAELRVWVCDFCRSQSKPFAMMAFDVPRVTLDGFREVVLNSRAVVLCSPCMGASFGDVMTKLQNQ